jgi:hypothetical protein
MDPAIAPAMCQPPKRFHQRADYDELEQGFATNSLMTDLIHSSFPRQAVH